MQLPTDRTYHIHYTNTFIHDLEDTVRYISHSLNNSQAARSLIDEVENAIITRASNPTGYEPYESKKKRRFTYYRIYVKKFIIYYIVINNTMEIRRFIFGSRNIGRLL